MPNDPWIFMQTHAMSMQCLVCVFHRERVKNHMKKTGVPALFSLSVQPKEIKQCVSLQRSVTYSGSFMCKCMNVSVRAPSNTLLSSRTMTEVTGSAVSEGFP